MKVRVLLLGCGNVGRGLCSLFSGKGKELAERYGVELSLTGAATRTHGCAVDPDGLDPRDVLSGRAFSTRPSRVSTMDLVETSGYDVLAECTVTNPETGEPALSHIRTALERGKSVTTSNKGPIALRFHELRALAKARGARLLYEGTVMAGTPLFSAAHPGFLGAEIASFEGVLNGTCNYMIERMKTGTTFDAALSEAQAKGYAEAEPGTDLGGWDTALKALILAQSFLDFPPMSLRDVDVEGVYGLTPGTLAEAASRGGTVRLVARGERPCAGSGVRPRLSVGPKFLPADHPLANLPETANGVVFSSDATGPVSFMGAGAGGPQTAFAVLRDIIDIATGMKAGRK